MICCCVSAETKRLQDGFNYLHKELGISHEDIVACPRALLFNRARLQERHQFLEHIGRAQYDPTKPNYIPLFALASLPADTFCMKYAKVSKEQFDNYSKTL